MKAWAIIGAGFLIQFSASAAGASAAGPAALRPPAAPAVFSPAIVFAPNMPGPASGVQESQRFTLSTSALAAEWTWADGHLALSDVRNPVSGRRYPQSGRELFRVVAEGLPGAEDGIPASAFELAAPPRLVRLNGNPRAVRGADRLDGWMLRANFRHLASGIAVEWGAEIRDGSHYVRQRFFVRGTRGTLTLFQGLELAAGEARPVGSATAGNPVCTDELFAGLELPMSRNRTGVGSPPAVVGDLPCRLPLESGRIYEFSSVVGAYPPGQLRRAFLAYLERERAAPYRPFLHYNGWFDIERNVNEAFMLETIAAYQRELISRRGIPVQSFVVDDGWDDWDAGFWTINQKKFPNGFQRLSAELQRIGSRFGIWISPLAGYDHADQRIAWAAKAKLTVPGGDRRLDLSYPPYYRWFLDKCTRLMRENRVNYFKLDKAGDGVNPHFLALFRLCRDLRQVDAGVFINITVGTWPSPFWLHLIDCTWREGNDMGYEGPGNDREKWITYRDAQTWRGVVSRAPLYPLNSIMNHGICLSSGGHFFPERAFRATTDMRHEARSYFGSGTALQELYVKPSVTPPEAWDQIAEAARWAHAHADVLVDTHWVGGNPSQGGEVYGWAAWAPRKGLLTLRNPSDKPQTFTLDVARVLELPEGAATRFAVSSPYADTPAPIRSLQAGEPVDIHLAPFDVLVLEMTPQP